MDRPQQRATCTARKYRPSHQGLAGFLGISFLLLVPGCAQLDQLMGKQAGAGEPAPQAQAAEPAPVTPAPKKHSVQAAEPASKPAAKKKTDASHAASVTPESASKQPEQDKALTEKDQLKKENKARVASDKQKKPAKSQVESQPPTEDVFLSPIPLPSKPAAIGGSGG